MNKIRNQKVINRIADKTRKSYKKKNIVAIFAIALTTLLFTTLFTIGSSILDKSQQSTMRQVGGSDHAGYKYLTEKEYSILKQDKKIKDLSYRITIGDVTNKELIKICTEANYYEDLNAKSSFCYPEIGHMPEKENELVTSDLVLDALNIPCELGQTVSLQLEIGSQTVNYDFVLSGYYHGDMISAAQIVLLSKTFQEKYAPLKTTSFMASSPSIDDEYCGRIMADFNFSNSLFLTQQLAALTKRCGFPQTINTGINWAYLGSSLNAEIIGTVAALLAVIILSGYLIIYNIFYIHVYSDIRHYGLLKTIGTTGQQLKKIVQRQAYSLSLLGIPFGLIGGVLIGKGILPLIMRNLNFSNTIDTNIELNPWIFIGATLFSLFTVYLSCIKPCKIAAAITPIEAVRTTEADTFQAQTVSTKTQKKTKKITPRQLAVQNVNRNRKKIFVVVASLSLAIILLNSIYNLVRGFDLDKYIASMTISDFSIANATLDNVSVDVRSRVLDGVTTDFITQLEQQTGITDIGHIYITPLDYFPSFTEEDWAKMEERLLTNSAFKNDFDAMGHTEISFEDYIEQYRRDKSLDGAIYGISELILNKLEQVNGTLDWDTFQSGDYVIATRWNAHCNDDTLDYFFPDETVTLFNIKGEAKTYKIMAIAELPYACSFQVYGTCGCDFLLPAEEFLDFMGEQQPMRTLFNVDASQEQAIEQWLDTYCSVMDTNLDYSSKTKIVAEFQSTKNMFSIVGGLLVFILAIIGMLNFINTMATSILSRKQELAMMEAVGMSQTQQIQMLKWEGLYYVILTETVALILGTLFNVLLVRPFGEGFFFFTWHFSITPIVVCLPFMLLIVILVPTLFYKNICSADVVERIRHVE